VSRTDGTLKERLAADLRSSMLARDKVRLGAVRMLTASVKNREVELRHPLSDEEFVEVATREVKRRREAIEAYEKAGREDRVMNDLALECGHRLHRHIFARRLDCGDGLLRDGHQHGPTLGSMPGHVEHEPAPFPGRGLDGKPGQLLQRLQNFAVGADQTARDAAFLGVHDRHGGAVTVNIHIDVTVHVGDVEELLEEVGRHLTLTLEGR